MDHKRTRRGTKFLVKWVGYPDATWEPEEFLKNEIGEDLELLKEYIRKQSAVVCSASGSVLSCSLKFGCKLFIVLEMKFIDFL